METHGIIVWMDKSCSSALVFCADGADIAVVSDLSKVLSGAMTPREGDLVGLNCRAKGGVRICEKIWTIAPNECSGLAAEIRQMAEEAGAFKHSA